VQIEEIKTGISAQSVL